MSITKMQPSDFQHYLAAGHPSVTVEQLTNFALHESEHVRLRVAEHERTTDTTLEMLANDQIAEVRAAVAAHPKTPLHILNRLSIDDNADVRLEMASDLNIPQSVLCKLADDENPYVAHQAKRTLQQLSPLAPPLSFDSHKRVGEFEDDDWRSYCS